jgi:hypothetical protein
MGWVVTSFALAAAVFAVPSDVQSQSSPASAIQRAVELESEASGLQNQRDQWEYAAVLYMAAVQLREEGDPQAQADLLIVANLSYETGNTAGALAALETAGARALASGDVVGAANIFTDAAWVASKAGLRIDKRRLSTRVTQLANSSEISRTERNQILSRFQGV